MPKIAWKCCEKMLFFFDISKWLLKMICLYRCVSKHPPDFRELFSRYIEAPNHFSWKKFWLQNCLWQAVFYYIACEGLANWHLWCSLQNRNANIVSSSKSVSFRGWRTWLCATFYLSFLWKNNFSSKFWKKGLSMAHP